jgi:hypothetical protein
VPHLPKRVVFETRCIPQCPPRTRMRQQMCVAMANNIVMSAQVQCIAVRIHIHLMISYIAERTHVTVRIITAKHFSMPDGDRSRRPVSIACMVHRTSNIVLVCMSSGQFKRHVSAPERCCARRAVKHPPFGCLCMSCT